MNGGTNQTSRFAVSVAQQINLGGRTLVPFRSLFCFHDDKFLDSLIASLFRVPGVLGALETSLYLDLGSGARARVMLSPMSPGSPPAIQPETPPRPDGDLLMILLWNGVPGGWITDKPTMQTILDEVAMTPGGLQGGPPTLGFFR